MSMNHIGFLSRAPHGLRLSATQKLAMQRAIDSILHDSKQKNRDDQTAVLLIDLCKRLMGKALTSYPEDRSCHTCIHGDSGSGFYCGHWKQRVPEENRETGCNMHLEDIPF